MGHEVLRYHSCMITSQKKSKTLQAVAFDAKPGKVSRRVRYDRNPFLEGVVSTFGDKRVRVSMKPNLAEIDNVTGEITRIPGEIVKIVSADKGSFIKLYSAHLHSFFNLTRSGQSVVEYLVHSHQQDANRHLVILHRITADQEGYEIPESTWFTGIRELIAKDFLAAGMAPNSYYLNPAIFFNGDRTKFITEIRKDREKERELGASAGQLFIESSDLL
jgi:hypothetical protein